MTLPLQLFKNSIDAQEKLRLNLHSLSVSELLEYGRKYFPSEQILSVLLYSDETQINIHTTIVFHDKNPIV